MNNKEFVSFLRVYLTDKNKLSKKQVEELKELLSSVYNELPQDIVIKDESWKNRMERRAKDIQNYRTPNFSNGICR